jgi:hypothetical protein
MATQERSDSPTLRNTKIIGTASQRRRKKGRAAKDLPLQRSQDPRSDSWRFYPARRRSWRPSWTSSMIFATKAGKSSGCKTCRPTLWLACLTSIQRGGRITDEPDDSRGD